VDAWFNLAGGVGAKEVLSTADIPTGLAYVEAWIDPAGTIKVAINGGAAASLAVANTTLTNTIGAAEIGTDTGGAYWNASIIEVGAAKLWSSTAQTALRSYMTSRFGL
jgi:hypothetical protein